MTKLPRQELNPTPYRVPSHKHVETASSPGAAEHLAPAWLHSREVLVGRRSSRTRPQLQSV